MIMHIVDRYLLIRSVDNISIISGVINRCTYGRDECRVRWRGQERGGGGVGARVKGVGQGWGHN